MTSWDLSETHSLVRKIFGVAQEQLTSQSTRSVNDRKSFAYDHFAEAMRLSRDFDRKHLSDVKTLLRLNVQGSEKKRRAFENYMIKAGAHSLAAVQSIHALPDILAHATYFATGQNLESHALADRDIALLGVSGTLKRDHRFSALSAPLSELQSGSGWRHLAAVCNMSKHQSVVRSTLSEDWTGTRLNHRELHISSFMRHGVHYAGISMKDLLEPEYDRVSNAIVTIGNELNACLRKLAP